MLILKICKIVIKQFCHTYLFRKMKFLLLISIVALAHGQNYCDKSLCEKGTHIACNNTGEWSKRCSSSYSLINLGPYVHMILNSHNEKRNEIASGELRPFRAAAQMGVMEWDTELAYLAELNLRKCKGLQHDSCHNTQDFKYSGQNIAEMRYIGYDYTVEFLINDLIDGWWNEYKVANPKKIAKYPKYYNRVIGHFTVMAAEKNVRVGCAAVHHIEDSWEKFLIACNYATTNIIDNPIYVAGAATTGCKTGRDRIYNNLCSRSEKYPLNKI